MLIVEFLNFSKGIFTYYVEHMAISIDITMWHVYTVFQSNLITNTSVCWFVSLLLMITKQSCCDRILLMKYILRVSEVPFTIAILFWKRMRHAIWLWNRHYTLTA